MQHWPIIKVVMNSGSSFASSDTYFGLANMEETCRTRFRGKIEIKFSPDSHYTHLVRALQCYSHSIAHFIHLSDYNDKENVSSIWCNSSWCVSAQFIRRNNKSTFPFVHPSKGSAAVLISVMSGCVVCA